MGLSCAQCCLGLSLVVFASSQGYEGIVLLRYAVVGIQTVLAWPIVEGLVNPAVLVWLIVSLAMCNPALTLILGGIMPSSGVAVC